MSLTAFKRKSVIRFGSNVSGKPTHQLWMPQGPFGTKNTTNSVDLIDNSNNYSSAGFSINGPHRSGTYIGKTSEYSKNGTPFRGAFAIGNGGHLGKYNNYNNVFNVDLAYAFIEGNQTEFVKPTTVSTYNMLRQKYKWAFTGTYPNYWVQPNYTGNQTDSASQGLFIHTKSAQNDIYTDINNSSKYINYFKRCGPNNCQSTPARGYRYTVQASVAPYTKNLKNAQTSSQHTLHIQRKCANPTQKQKPFPYATNGDTCNQIYQLTPNYF
uniref:Uncharacterized protein n=1 Tax=viral metagenome TaxID=1070528 RepID=A0A6C0H4T3_9ZZZZ